MARRATVAVLLVCSSCFPSTMTDDDGGQLPEAGEAGDGGQGDGGAKLVWTQRAPLPLPRTGHGVAAAAGKVYVMGGSSGSMLSRVDAYDPASDTWSQKTDMPEARREFAIGAINDKIYVAGGMSYSDSNAVTYVPTTRMYDPSTDSWSERAPCPISAAPNGVWGNQFFGGGVVDGLFYVVVFTAGQGATMYAYDPTADTWTSESAGGVAGQNLGAQFTTATIGDVMYVFSSPFGPGEISGQLWSWYSSSATWVVGGVLAHVWRSAFFTLNGNLYSVGGVTGDSGSYAAYAGVYAYDAPNVSWVPAGMATVAREYAGAAVLDDHVYVIGGDVPVMGGNPIPTAAVEDGVLE